MSTTKLWIPGNGSHLVAGTKAEVRVDYRDKDHKTKTTVTYPACRGDGGWITGGVMVSDKPDRLSDYRIATYYSLTVDPEQP